jgi:ribosomal protein L24E
MPVVNSKCRELVEFLERLSKEEWTALAREPVGIELVRDNLGKADWANLLRNPAAVEMVKANPDKVAWAEM